MKPSFKTLFLVLVISLLFFSCQKKEVVEEAKVTETELKPLETPEFTQALVTYLSGEVTVLHSQVWEPVEIGAFVEKEDTVKVGEDSFCEIQFGNTASIRIQANTEVSIETVFLKPEESNIEVKMAVGSILAKVGKLTGDEKFIVKTNRATCGVRGTEFLVKEEAGKATILAVKKGSVAVLPASVNMDRLKQRLGGENEQILQIVKKIEDSAPLVEADQEIVIEENTLAETEVTFKAVVEAVEEIVQDAEKKREAEAKIAEAAKPEAAKPEEKAAKAIVIPEEKLKKLNASVEVDIQNVTKTMGPSKEVSKENLEDLNAVDEVKIVEIPIAALEFKAAKVEGAPKEEKAAEEEKPAPAIKLVKVALKAVPVDSIIALNGKQIGKGSYSGLFTQGDVLSFLITKAGYRDAALDVKVEEGVNKAYEVVLEEVKKAEPASKVKEEEERRKLEEAKSKEEAEQRLLAEQKKLGEDEQRRIAEEKRREEERQRQMAEARRQEEERGKAEEQRRLAEQRQREEQERIGAQRRQEEEQRRIAQARASEEARRQEEERNRLEAESRRLEQERLAEGEQKRLEEARKKREAAEIAARQAARESVTISVTPGDADILLDGKFLGRGSYTGDYTVGEKLAFTIRKEDYYQKNLEVTVEKDGRNRYTVSLAARPIINKFSVSNTTLIGSLVSADGIILSADRHGILAASDMNGRILWTHATDNGPNENSYPVVIRDKVYFTGSNQFIILDLKSGRPLKEIDLDRESAHLFGRKVIEYDGNGIYPANNTLRFFELNNGRTRYEIALPNGSKMTPALYNGKVLIVNQNGVLLIIDPEKKSIESTVPTGAVQPVATSVKFVDNRGIIAGRRGTIVSVDLTSGRVLWEKTLSGDGAISIFHDVECDGRGVYVYAKDTLYALGLSNGEVLFKPLEGLSAPPLLWAGYLYYGTRDGNFAVAEAATGRVLNTLYIKERITTRPIYENGKIYAGTEVGNVYVFNPEGIK